MKNTEMITQFSGMRYGALERVLTLSRLLNQLGQPDHAFKIIHICGTNGKGSTGTVIARLLQAQGYRVGLFTSPYIMCVEESIQINQQPISSAQFNQTLNGVQQALKVLGIMPKTTVSYFEMLVLVALVYFQQQAVDYLILECGLGGQLDATNAIDQAAYTIFTKISLDHTAILGKTIQAIATTKSKIIRPKTPVVIAPHQDAVAQAVLTAEAHRKNAPLLAANLNWIKANQPTASGQKVTLKLPDCPEFSVEFSLAGHYQLENLATALVWYQRFCEDQRRPIDRQVVQTALAAVHLPGRFEQLHTAPVVIADGAHNPDGIQQLVASVKERYPRQSFVIVTGFLKDKDVQTCLKYLTTLPAQFIVTEPVNPDRRALSANTLQRLLQTITTQSVTTQVSIKEALLTAQQIALTRQSKPIILVVGSFYLLKTVRQYYQTMEETDEN